MLPHLKTTTVTLEYQVSLEYQVFTIAAHVHICCRRRTMQCHFFDPLAIVLSICTSLCILLRLILYALAYTGEAGKKKMAW